MAVKVLFQGSFDILNSGHVEAFKFAKAQGDYLIVAVNTNRLLKSYKHRVAVMPWKDKKTIIEAFRDVDKVIPAPDFSPLKLLKEHDIDVYIIADEWLPTKQREIAYMKKKGGKVVVAKRFGGVATSKIKAILLKEYLDATHSKNVPRNGGLQSSGQVAKHHSNGSAPPYRARKRPTGPVWKGQPR